jgi:DNA mismatch endonuclease (patch repair protein)
MVDVLTSEQRRYNMSRIKGGNTKPELLIRRALHAEGFRYRLHQRDLAGRPDIVLPKFRTVIFVHGCFWHGHDCHLVKKVETRAEFWQSKLSGNVERDRDVIRSLQSDGWKVAVVWECALRGTTKRPLETVTRRLTKFIIAGGAAVLNISGESSHETSSAGF